MNFQLASRQTSSENCHSDVLVKRARSFQILLSNSNFVYLQQHKENCRIIIYQIKTEIFAHGSGFHHTST